MPLELLLEVRTVQVLASKCGTDPDAMAAVMNQADIVRVAVESSDVAAFQHTGVRRFLPPAQALKVLFAAKVDDAVQHIGSIFDAATGQEWKGIENSEEESALKRLVQPPEVYNPVLEEWDEDKVKTMFLANEEHMGTIGQMYRALNTKLTLYTTKREAARLPVTPALGKFKEFMSTIATYVGITVVVEALLVTGPRDKEQAITDLKAYQKEFEAQHIEIPATLMRKMDEALTGK